MYLLKAKRNQEQQDQKEFAEKRDRFLDRQEKLSVMTQGGMDIDKLEEPPAPGKMGLKGPFRPEDLPDGICISPKKMTRSNPYENDGNTAVREASYIGSFSVIGEDQNARAEYVRKQLMEMRNVTKTKPVLLVISLSGVKVCSSTGESVYMAHALKRISYATCDPDFCQFSFLAREPKGHTNIQYCHGFITATPREAEELNAIVGNAFKMAFTHQRESQQQSDPAPATLTATPAATTTATPPTETSPPPLHRQPTFHEMIEQQISVQKEQSEQQTRRREQELTKRLSEISTAKVDERMREISERRRKDKEDADREAEIQRQQRLQGKDRTTWSSVTHIV